MATLTPIALARTGTDIAGVTPGGSGDDWVNTGAEFVAIKNGSGAGITVTLDIVATVDGAAVVDPTVAIAAGATKLIGPFPKGIYNDPVTGKAKVTCSATASVTIAVVRGSLG